MKSQLLFTILILLASISIKAQNVFSIRGVAIDRSVNVRMVIPVSGGSESFTGLPGMILGVALPREHITWFATLVKDSPVLATAITAPKKGKPTDYKGLVTTLQGAMKNWGDYAQGVLKAFLL